MIIPSVIFCGAGVARLVGDGTDLRLYGDNGHYVQLNPGSPNSDYILIMPSGSGTDGQFMQISVGGQLIFTNIDISDVDGLGTAAAANTGDFAQSSHTHSLSDITDAGTAAAADTGDFAPFVHTHTGDFATTSLDNLSDVSINDHIIPSGNLSIDLGDENTRFRHGYIHKLRTTHEDQSGIAFEAWNGTTYQSLLSVLADTGGNPTLFIGEYSLPLESGSEGQVFKVNSNGNIIFANESTGGGPHTHVLADITDAGTAAAADTGDFATATHTHSLADITNAGTAAAADTGDFAPFSHTHSLSDITDAGTAAAANTGDFAPSSHTHLLADITDAGTAAAADTGDFAPFSHTHTGDFTSTINEMWIPGGYIYGRTTSGAQVNTFETTTNKINIDCLDFDPSSQEFGQFSIAWPSGWSTVNADIYWTAASSGASVGVTWSLGALALSNDDAIDQAIGTTGQVNDTLTAINDCDITSTITGIVPGNTPSYGDYTIFEVSRVVANANDTLSVDARLIGILLKKGS